MSRRRERPPERRRGAATAGILLGTLIGATFALFLYFLVTWAGQPWAGPSGAARRIGTANPLLDPIGVYLLFGSAIGFLVGHYALSMVARFARLCLRLGILMGGAGLGAAIGAIAYAIMWALNAPPGSEGSVGRQIAAALTRPDDLARAFLFSGGLSGFIVTAYLLGGHILSRFLRRIAGALLGSVAGVLIYSFAYVATLYPLLPRSSEYLAHFAEAIYSFSPAEFLFILLGAGVGSLLASYSWRFYGVSTLLSLVAVVLGYVIFTFVVTLPRVPPGSRAFSNLLFILEFCSLSMFIVYSFYTVDVSARKRWRRVPQGAPFSKYYLPRVAIHVPTYNEPPEIVLGTLRSLVDIEYPAGHLEIVVVDDSTQPEYSVPVRDFCQRNGIRYFHRADRTGFKAGALNHALRQTGDEIELIAVVDSDYVVDPTWLAETVGYFVDPRLGWLQTPQDYRNQDQSFLTRQYYFADAYFYRTVLPSRNEENSIIFCGTMGILRRDALEEVGAWGEEFVTEDSELSIRLIDHGYQSLYVNKSYGRGLIPPTFDGYKKQHYRWAFGSGEILRGHFRRILFGRFTGRQSFDYLLGSFHWFDGLFILGLALALLYMGVADILGTRIINHHSNEIALLGLVPLFLLLDGFTRVHMVLRNSLNLSFGDTLRIIGMWFSVKFSNTFGSLKALLGLHIPFLRTPKGDEDRIGRWAALGRALRLARLESVMAIALAATAIGVAMKIYATPDVGGITLTRVFLAVWLAYYAFVFTAAPLYAYKSFTTFRRLQPQPAVARTPVVVPQ